MSEFTGELIRVNDEQMFEKSFCVHLVIFFASLPADPFHSEI